MSHWISSSIFSSPWAMGLYTSVLRNTSWPCTSPAAFGAEGVRKRPTFVLTGSAVSFVSPASWLSFLADCWPCWLTAQCQMEVQQTYTGCLTSSQDYRGPNPYNNSFIPWSNPSWHDFPKAPEGTLEKQKKKMINCIWALREWENLSENSGTGHSSFHGMCKDWCYGNYNG